MKKILVDVSVVLDVLLNREPHVRASATIWAAVETRKVDGLLSAHAVTTVHYLVRKEVENVKAKRIVQALLGVFGVAAVDQTVIRGALNLPSADFEDAVAAAAAHTAGCDLVITQDPRRFRGSLVRAVTPEAGAHILASE